VAGLAVNADPSIQSPDPLLRFLFFRQSVIDAVSAPDHEQPVSDFMRSAGGVLAESSVDDELANPEWLLFSGFRADLYGTPLPQNYGVGLGDGKTATSQQQKADEYT